MENKTKIALLRQILSEISFNIVFALDIEEGSNIYKSIECTDCHGVELSREEYMEYTLLDIQKRLVGDILPLLRRDV
ncbi:hypothetical protein GZH82_12440 [Staphylococcus ursi]|uniref:hypothetical protein n=1 Tax=Staphylococcus sp. MI 10-1553 TaxID=1912064 RepID=UPI0013973641|nr:hypothetical protein [Staphylococcus sp. MI 10-1553]QHW38089.1 hypothetical protein GZH82_12440 [Staphylococcus sp. MI 10-1553]